MFDKCRVTVVQRMVNRQLIEEFLTEPGRMGLCNKLADGQEFIIENPWEMPAGMCASAWADIRPYIIAIASGGSFKFMKDENSTIAGCTDIFRPVIFKIERV